MLLVQQILSTGDMGRSPSNRALSIWCNGVRVGRWAAPARGGAVLQYDQTWVDSSDGRPLSLSLPFSRHNVPLKGAPVFNYFDNLLPDSDAIRRRVAERFRADSTEVFDLLAAVGRDCVGAVQLLPEGEAPSGFDRIEGVPLSEGDIERHLLAMVSRRGPGGTRVPSGGTDDGVAGDDAADDGYRDIRISLAGAQEKTALLRWNGQWLMPRGATPTSHIIKLPLGLVGGMRADFTTSVDNEWLCLRLLKAYGLPVAEAGIETFGSQRVLVVERFDRQVSRDGRWLMRLPQEDFCQATGCSPLRKYENEGGPGLQALFGILKHSERAGADQRTLMAAQILFWMLRAPDAHAKNYSVRLLPQGRFHLTRLYDVMSAWPVLGDGGSQWSPYKIRLAMALLGRSRHYAMHSVRRRHFSSTAQKVAYAPGAEALIEEILARTPQAIAEVQAALPAGISPRVVDAILGGVQQAASQLRDGSLSS